MGQPTNNFLKKKEITCTKGNKIKIKNKKGMRVSTRGCCCSTQPADEGIQCVRLNNEHWTMKSHKTSPPVRKRYTMTLFDHCCLDIISLQFSKRHITHVAVQVSAVRLQNQPHITGILLHILNILSNLPFKIHKFLFYSI